MPDPRPNGTTMLRRPADLDGEIRVSVCEENEILRRGLVASLAEDRGLVVTADGRDDPHRDAADIAIVSRGVAATDRFRCPIIIITDESRYPPPVADGNRVVGVLQRRSLTGVQLRATVRAAAAGLVINEHVLSGSDGDLDDRSKQVLELLADGHSTREIAAQMSYSERTIKKLVMGLQHHFQARSRAQIVAEAIRGGLI